MSEDVQPTGKVHKQVINIGDTDQNADWIKHLPGYEDELKIHEELAEKYGRGNAKPEAS